MKTTPIRLVSSSLSGSSDKAPWSAGLLSRFYRCSFVLLVLLTLSLTHRAVGQKFPPDRLSYQGYITDATGTPLGLATPTNYTVKFSIFAAPSGGSPLWAETQIVTFDKGQYSVLLGQGTPSVPGALLTSVVTNNRVDLFVETAVDVAGTLITIKPRLQLIPTPYAFVATRALAAEKADMATTAQLATTALNANTAGSAASLSGTVSAGQISGTLETAQLKNLAVTGAKIADDTITSAKIKGKLEADQIPELDASKITTGVFLVGRMPSFMARRDVPNTFTPDQTMSGNLTVNGSLNLGAYKAPAANENLRIVRGRVKLQQAGGIYNYVIEGGQGFTVTRNLTYNPGGWGPNNPPGWAAGRGVVDITFNPPFLDIPAVTVTGWGDTASLDGAAPLKYTATVHLASPSKVTVSFYNAQNNGYILDSPFNFIAVGQR